MEKFGEGVKKVLLAGVGAAAVTAEKSKEIIEEMAKKGEATVERGKVMNQELKYNIKKTVKENVNVSVKATTPEELDVLLENMSPEQIEQLKERISHMEETPEEACECCCDEAEEACECCCEEAAAEKEEDGALHE